MLPKQRKCSTIKYKQLLNPRLNVLLPFKVFLMKLSYLDLASQPLWSNPVGVAEKPDLNCFSVGLHSILIALLVPHVIFLYY